jgi:hypothetical protein
MHFLFNSIREGATAPDEETAVLLRRHLGVAVAVAPSTPTPAKRIRT